MDESDECTSIAHRRERRSTARYEPYAPPARKVTSRTQVSCRPRRSAKTTLLTLSAATANARQPQLLDSAGKSKALVAAATSTALVPFDPTAPRKQRFAGRFATMLEHSSAVAAADRALGDAVAAQATKLRTEKAAVLAPPPRKCSNSDLVAKSGTSLLLLGPSACSQHHGRGKRGAKMSKKARERSAKLAVLSDDEPSGDEGPDRLGMLQQLGKAAPRWSDSPLPDDRAKASVVLLRRLASYLRQCGGEGALITGWKAQFRTSRSVGTYGQHATTYIAPTGRKMSSMAEVAWYLGLQTEMPCGLQRGCTSHVECAVATLVPTALISAAATHASATASEVGAVVPNTTSALLLGRDEGCDADGGGVVLAALKPLLRMPNLSRNLVRLRPDLAAGDPFKASTEMLGRPSRRAAGGEVGSRKVEASCVQMPGASAARKQPAIESKMQPHVMPHVKPHVKPPGAEAGRATHSRARCATNSISSTHDCIREAPDAPPLPPDSNPSSTTVPSATKAAAVAVTVFTSTHETATAVVTEPAPSTASITTVGSASACTTNGVVDGSWSEAELSRLRRIHLQTSPTRTDFWQQVARRMDGRSEDECAEQFFTAVTGDAKESSMREAARRPAEVPPTGTAQSVCIQDEVQQDRRCSLDAIVIGGTVSVASSKAVSPTPLISRIPVLWLSPQRPDTWHTSDY
jgi:hypothetical protein